MNPDGGRRQHEPFDAVACANEGTSWAPGFGPVRGIAESFAFRFEYPVHGQEGGAAMAGLVPSEGQKPDFLSPSADRCRVDMVGRVLMNKELDRCGRLFSERRGGRARHTADTVKIDVIHSSVFASVGRNRKNPSTENRG